MRRFSKIDVNNTIAEWVDAFNNNALASNDHTWYLGEMLYNGMLYTGLETIGGQKVESFKNLNVSSISPRVVQFDNMYLYFRNINKILLVDKVTFDLTEFNTGHPMFFYIDSELGYRASQEFRQNDNEIMLFRFIISESGVFEQMYITAQRFGSNVYDTADEFYQVKGCEPLPAGALTLKLGNGSIKRSGIRFDYHNIPDVYFINDQESPYKMRYIEEDNTVNYRKSPVTEVDITKYLNYTTNKFTTVPAGKVTAQRVLFDVYQGCLILQYGDSCFDTLQQAMTQIDNLVYPFPYNNLVYIPLGIMFVKSNADDLTDKEQCILVQHLNTTVVAGDSAFFAEDSYARGRLVALDQQIADLHKHLGEVESSLNAHLQDFSNPHKVTKEQVGLGKVENLSWEETLNRLDKRYLRKDISDSTPYNLTVGGELRTNKQWIAVNNHKVFVGSRGPNPVSGDYGLF